MASSFVKWGPDQLPQKNITGINIVVGKKSLSLKASSVDRTQTNMNSLLLGLEVTLEKLGYI